MLWNEGKTNKEETNMLIHHARDRNTGKKQKTTYPFTHPTNQLAE